MLLDAAHCTSVYNPGTCTQSEARAQQGFRAYRLASKCSANSIASAAFCSAACAFQAALSAASSGEILAFPQLAFDPASDRHPVNYTPGTTLCLKMRETCDAGMADHAKLGR